MNTKKIIVSLRKEGLKNTLLKTKQFIIRHRDIQKFRKSTGINWSFSDNNHEITPYDSMYQQNENFLNYDCGNIKPIAFYLPQFHRIKENDEWWGEGFTEWTNTRKGKPQYEGHYQPRVPHKDIGYYDLSNIETIKEQVKLAKKHGIFGFCFYYYWFSGRRIMEKPVDLLIQHPEIKMPFCLCWANENFTRNWDGLKSEILLQQYYTKDDRKNFIIDLIPYFEDERYIRIDNKPLILVYNPKEIPEIEETIHCWRETAIELNIGEILIWTCRTANETAKSLKIEKIIDAEVEFPPRNIWYDIIKVSGIKQKSQGNIFNYGKLVEMCEYQLENEKESEIPLYHTCMTGWDNTARRNTMWMSFYGYSLKKFYRWVSSLVKNALEKKNDNEQFFFINAWNEWAEGTYLEPDEKFGYANINTFSKALYGIPYESIVRIEGQSKDFSKLNEKVCIAVQAHLFYTDELLQIVNQINQIPYPYDLFISTDTNEKKSYIIELFSQESTAQRITVDVIENKGRDVRPFLFQMQSVYDNYRYICHIHTKKTINDDYGTMWCQYLYKNLFDSSDNIREIIDLFESNEEIGIIFPEDYPLISHQVEWGGNEKACKDLLEKLEITDQLELTPVFPAGNMFWARSEAIADVFEKFELIDLFPDEKGQLNLTLAHQIERIWCYIVRKNGFKHQKIYNACRESVSLNHQKRMVIFVHHHPFAFNEYIFLEELSEKIDKIVFVSDCKFDEDQIATITKYTSDIRFSIGNSDNMDIWRQILLSEGPKSIEQYQEVILISNNNLYVNKNLKNMFFEMGNKDIDYWTDVKLNGINTVDFICLNDRVIHSHTFWTFWDKNNNKKVSQESIIEYLEESGFSYDYFVKESDKLIYNLYDRKYLSQHPSMMVILDCPFIKRESEKNMHAYERNKLFYLINRKRVNEQQLV